MDDDKKQPKAPSLDSTLWRVSATLRGPKGGGERFRFYEADKASALKRAHELLYVKAAEDVVVRDPSSSATWDVKKHPKDPARLQITERKGEKKPARYQVWIRSGGAGAEKLYSVHKREADAEAIVKTLGGRARVKPIFD